MRATDPQFARLVEQIAEETIIDEQNAIAGGTICGGAIASSFDPEKPETLKEESEEVPSKKKVVKIKTSKSLNPKSLETIKDFIKFAQKKLDVETFPVIHLHKKKTEGMTTGAYDRETNSINCLVGNRLIVDILRTLAHELTHRKQDETGMLETELAKINPELGEMGDLNTPFENEAYEKSGNMVKEWSRIQKVLPREELYQLHEGRNFLKETEAHTSIRLSSAQADKLGNVLSSLGINPETVIKPVEEPDEEPLDEQAQEPEPEDLKGWGIKKPSSFKKLAPKIPGPPKKVREKFSVDILPESIEAAKKFYDIGQVGANWYYEAHNTIDKGFKTEEDKVLFALLLAATSVQNEVYTNFIEAAVEFNAIKKDIRENTELVQQFVNDESLKLSDKQLLAHPVYGALHMFKDTKTAKITAVGSKFGNIKRFLKLYVNGQLTKATVRSLIAPTLAIKHGISFDSQNALIRRLKIANFAMTLVDPEFASSDQNPFNVVVDTWMFRVFYPEKLSKGMGKKGKDVIGKLFGSEPAYANVSAAVSALAAQAGVSPHVMQAALWTGIKRTWEGESADATNYVSAIQHLVTKYSEFWQGMEKETSNLAAIIAKLDPTEAAKYLKDRRAEFVRAVVARGAPKRAEEKKKKELKKTVDKIDKDWGPGAGLAEGQKKKIVEVANKWQLLKDLAKTAAKTIKEEQKKLNTKPMMVYHLSSEGDLSFKSGGRYSPKFKQNGLFVSPSLKSTIADWSAYVATKKSRKHDNPNYDENRQALEYGTLYLYKISVPKFIIDELVKDYAERQNAAFEKSGMAAFGAWGWGEELFIPEKYFDQLSIVSKKKTSYKTLGKVSKKNDFKQFTYRRDREDKEYKKTLKEQIETQEQPVRLKMDIPLPNDLVLISKLYKLNKKELYLVGGAVRDALMEKTPKDYDLATDASPDESIEILRQDTNLKVLELGKAFGVIKALTPEGNEYEIAQFREDIGKGRRPEGGVKASTIEYDVRRRDLTLNALFYDIEKKEVVDYVGGIEDIRKGIVRTVGSPEERFEEDRLRILRALRFAARAGSSISPETAAAIKKDNNLTGVSPERIRDEFLKGIKSARSVPQFLGMISEFDLWPQVFPDLKIAEDFKDTNNTSIAVSIILRHNDPKVLIKKLNELKYSSDEVKQIVFLVNFQELNIDNAFKFKKMFLNARLSNEDILEFAKLTSRPGMNLAIPFTKYELSVSGDELLKGGFKDAQLGSELARRETENFRALL